MEKANIQLLLLLLREFLYESGESTAGDNDRIYYLIDELKKLSR